ncbi:oligoribonuclease [Serinibacter arcticus]|uniref:3'-to-5' oligoribonuclease (Orn) n=1 Tax=Serinibacter arcticus TaxID=1655435 RepID=A0A4Z1E9D6_9MICO|nr:3'-to-5' oligoribonuclease (orn) [Serinibacter arcticus]
MTGLDTRLDALIEVAVIVTDSDLTPLGEGIDIVIAPPPGAVEQMNDVVRTMHTTSGLLDELADGVTMESAREQVLEYVRSFVPEPRKAPLAGNSVGTDRVFLDRDMPEVVEHLHYRIIDVSSIKELSRRWYPRAYYASPKKAGGHRALADIAESIDELRYYRAALFPDGDGPSSADLKKRAALISASPTPAVVAASEGDGAPEAGTTPEG